MKIDLTGELWPEVVKQIEKDFTGLSSNDIKEVYARGYEMAKPMKAMFDRSPRIELQLGLLMMASNSVSVFATSLIEAAIMAAQVVIERKVAEAGAAKDVAELDKLWAAGDEHSAT